jgi:L-fucose isomerase-like protein
MAYTTDQNAFLVEILHYTAGCVQIQGDSDIKYVNESSRDVAINGFIYLINKAETAVTITENLKVVGTKKDRKRKHCICSANTDIVPGKSVTWSSITWGRINTEDC